MASNIQHLFTFGNYTLPMRFIVEDGYDIKPNQRQDLDPFTDQTGLTHRNALRHTKTEISITLRPNLTWAEFESIVAGITTNYSKWSERDAQCTYFDPETRTMKTGHFYLESSQAFKIKTVNKKYGDTTLVFVEY